MTYKSDTFQSKLAYLGQEEGEGRIVGACSKVERRRPIHVLLGDSRPDGGILVSQQSLGHEQDLGPGVGVVLLATEAGQKCVALSILVTMTKDCALQRSKYLVTSIILLYNLVGQKEFQDFLHGLVPD